MLDFQVNLFTIIFGTLILGLGYVGLLVRYLFLNKRKEFYEMKIIDKIIQSLVIGTLSFILTIQLGFLRISNLTTEGEIFSFLITRPTIFIYQFFFVIIFIYFLLIGELYVKLIIKIISSLKQKSSILH